ncbi:MAG TPA: hypothetical protein VMT50_06615, partial [Steroidobacteraceae bacterium]|nr:hypothetical protein [Steroidobacteraceae bacterium]
LETEVASGAPIEPDRAYRYRLDGGAQPVDGASEETLIFSGSSLLSLAREDLSDPRSLNDARRLLRAALDECLDGRSLRTREVLMEMRQLGGATNGG